MWLFLASIIVVIAGAIYFSIKWFGGWGLLGLFLLTFISCVAWSYADSEL